MFIVGEGESNKTEMKKNKTLPYSLKEKRR